MSTEYRRIKNRRDTSAGWIEKNPVLLEGELGLETDTRKIKFGDGVNYWIDLPYSGVDSQEITDIVTSISYTKNEVDQIVNTVEGSIPTNTSDLTNDSGFITSADVPTKTSDLTNDSGFITSADVPTNTSDLVNDSGFITSADVPTKTSDLTNDSGFITSADVPTKTSDLTNDSGFITINDVPAQQQADWTEVNTTKGSYIQNKPNLATVATSGSYNDLSNTPTIPTNTSDLNNDSGFITINDVPAQQQANWTETNTTLGSYIQNKPSLATVATSGDYTDLSNTPSLATVATSGDYNDLTNTPTIPSDTSDLTNNAGFITINDIPAQAQADWTEADTSDPSYIQNKPTIPTVNDATVTFTQGGVTKGSVTLNQGTDATIALDAGGGTQVNADWNESDPNDPAYIENKPTIPAAQVNSDWNSNNGVSKILNKPRMGVETLVFTLSDQSTVSIDVWVKDPGYFYIEDISGQPNTLSITKTDASAPSIEVFSSTDGKNWTSMGTTSTTAITATVPANRRLYLKAIANKWAVSYNGDKTNRISLTNDYNIGGDIMSLLNGDNFTDTLLGNYSSIFEGLFGGETHLISASNLILPNNVQESCYRYMFSGCTNLITAPATLPATTLANKCYSGMFQFCENLTTSPVIIANNTTSATNLAFTTMFYNCTRLNKVVTYCNIQSFNYYGWLDGVAAQGDFYNLGTGTYTSGASGIPRGWTVHTSL